MAPLAKAATDFNNASKNGTQIMLYCVYYGDPERKKLPEKHIALTPREISIYNKLQQASGAAIEAEDAYEQDLITAHHINKPDLRDPCYFFVGIRAHDNFITVDPNPMNPECDSQ